MFSQLKDRKQIEQNFYSVARVMPRDGTCGCWGESKTLGWGFGMAPHRLRALFFLAFKLSDVVFILLINFKMPTIVGILTFMSRINFKLSWVEHEKSFITLGPDFLSHPHAY